ncbi:MAG: hypothetical protein IJW05_12255, partial [Lentisphaeria bacterium]|nr:hypothetical protein [Lentisphaeria bacterium]
LSSCFLLAFLTFRIILLMLPVIDTGITGNIFFVSREKIGIFSREKIGIFSREKIDIFSGRDLGTEEFGIDW